MSNDRSRQHGELRHIDPSAGLLGVRNSLQKTFLETQCSELIQHLDELVLATKFPKRTQAYRLNRSPRNGLTGERHLEHLLWQQWQIHSSCPVPNAWERLVAYQVPLFDSSKRDKWGAIDLLGISADGTPVIVELKIGHDEAKRNTPESPVRILVEAFAYALALRKMWSGFRPQFVSQLRHLQIPDSLIQKVPLADPVINLVGAAPASFWQQWLPISPKGLKVSAESWDAFRKLLQAIERHRCRVSFVSLLERPGGLHARTLKGFPLG